MSDLIQNVAVPSDEEVLDTIRQVLVGKPIARAYLFGSRAQGNATPESDWDILVDVERGFSLFDQARIQLELEDSIGKKIDLITSGGLRPDIKFYVDEDKILIYERRTGR